MAKHLLSLPPCSSFPSPGVRLPKQPSSTYHTQCFRRAKQTQNNSGISHFPSQPRQPYRGPGITHGVFLPVCEDHGGSCDHLCRLLAALSHILHPGELQGGHLPAEVHSAGVPGDLSACHEFNNVQPHHILLS